MKRSLSVFIVIVMLVTSVLSVNIVRAEVKEDVSPVTGYIGSEARAFAVKTFGNAKTPEELFRSLSDFAVENFTYNYSLRDKDTRRLQIFNYARFVKGTSFASDGIPFCGVCFDFALFASATVQIVSQYRDWKNVGIHTAQLEWVDDEGKVHYHAANFFTVGDTRYFLDLNADVDDRDKGFEKQGPIPMASDCSAQEFFDTNGYGYTYTGSLTTASKFSALAVKIV